MPPVNRQQPQFSPIGRYLINVEERKVEGPTYFHDLESMIETCGLADMPPKSISRFNNKAWAIQRGYTPCPNCKG